MEQLLSSFQTIVGNKNVITNSTAMANFTTGFRGGLNSAWATIIPNNLVELWQVAKLAVEHDLIIICQAANTSLTGGSTPDGEYERPVIIISTTKLKQIQLINNNQQVICFAGSRLYELEDLLRPLNREPHSVLGSSCVGASIVGGICNNSGGALVKRGPAFTQYSLYAAIVDGKLTLVNELGVNLAGDTPEEILSNLEKQNYQASDIINDPAKLASSVDYVQQVIQINQDSPARYNNDPKRLYQASGSAGKVVVFAVRNDTFVIDQNKKTFYIATSNPDVLMDIRRGILSAGHVPDQGEYMDAASYDQADKYGRDMHLIISRLGTKYIPGLFKTRAIVQRKLAKIKFFAKNPPIDYSLQLLNNLTPSRLSSRIQQMRKGNEHFLFICTSGDTTEFVADFLENNLSNRTDTQYIECDDQESKAIQLHRFVIGNAEGRARLMNRDKVGEFLSLDLALPRNATKYVEDDLPVEITSKLFERHSFGHFFCLVFHNYYSALPGVDIVQLKKDILAYQDSRNAQYPAEHNVGHMYKAHTALEQHYRQLNPNNRMNPGIGLTSRVKDWK